MALGRSVWHKYGKACGECGTLDDLTRHHLKNSDGKKTGVIQILCRDCHDLAEKRYERLGIVQKTQVKISKDEQLHLDYINGKIPSYSINPKKSREVLRH